MTPDYFYNREFFCKLTHSFILFSEQQIERDFVGLFKNTDKVKISPNDIEAYLENKIVKGSNVQVSFRYDRTYGNQFVISVPGDVPGAGGVPLEVNADIVMPNNVNLLLVSTATNPVAVTLPHPAEQVGWISIVCTEKNHGITLQTPEGVEILDRSNLEFQATGDSLLFAGNRADKWYCVGKYNADWYA